jgi:hypothetical protein
MIPSVQTDAEVSSQEDSMAKIVGNGEIVLILMFYEINGF